ncbi:MAG: 4-(cytidine 5'-diphospho)-2-C-methyl-D-erythritol kinase [Hyphomicrobium sp.]|nr:4-(cytidine 5'-diphospho)-2-C-methyl-D-erythritol kinase [Hyphomicrobium sp.]
MPNVLSEDAPAKVNLTLRVLGRRSDGYHELQSLVAFARDIGDVVTLDAAQPTRVTVAGPMSHALIGDNLVETAVRQIEQAIPAISVGAVALDKRLPVAAGVGGGSADAAALLRIVCRAHPALPAQLDIEDLARRLGADVPVCLINRPAMMSGVGERIAAVSFPAAIHAVLVNPMVPVPSNKTAQVFAALDAPPVQSTQVSADMPDVADLEALLTVMQLRGNDLQSAAISVMPVIEDVLAALDRSPSCLIARLSGAGPTCFGLYRTRDDAATAAALISHQNAKWWVRATLLA